jgi:signal transduction histidine kinase
VNAYRVNQLEFMLYTSGADKARSLQRMREVEAQVAASLQVYRSLIRGPEEQARLRDFEQSWQALVAVNYERFIPDATQNNTGAVRPFYSRMNPFYSDVEAALRSLNDSSQAQAAESLAVVQGAYQTARSFIVIDTLLAVVVSAAVGLILSGRLAHRLGRLTSAAGKVAAGDLGRTVETRGGDELGQLAGAFNQMVAGLRAQRSALEDRNAALVASLARQEQLTADLMRRRQAEEEANRAQAAAEAASQAKSMFLATMSHELRTPLNAILGYAQLLRMTAAQRGIDDESAQQLDRILVAGRHLTSLITNVLDFSKIK